MKPRNFPDRKIRRAARAKLAQGLPLTEEERLSLLVPTDVRFRPGRVARLVKK